MRQFHPNDTVSFTPRFGNNQDGSLTISADTTYDGANAGIIGTYTADPLVIHPTLTLDQASGFANGDLILIHQSRGITGTTTGVWEINKIRAGGGSTAIELEWPLQNTYIDNGAHMQAQVLELKQFSDVTIDSTKTYIAAQWDGNKGGIIAFFVNGTLDVNGTLSALGRGYRGGVGTNNTTAQQGESENGPGDYIAPPNNYNGSSGGGGKDLIGSGAGGLAFLTDPNLNTKLAFGGSGGGCAGQGYVGGTGGNSGGIVLVFAKTVDVDNSTGTITVDGGAGTNTLGGGPSAGCILLKAQTATLNTTRLSANGGNRGTFANNDDAGGAGAGAVDGGPGYAHVVGSFGVIHVDCNTLTGTANPTLTQTTSELYSDTYAHEGIFSTVSAALEQQKYKRVTKVVAY